jgi:hypothetical protein
MCRAGRRSPSAFDVDDSGHDAAWLGSWCVSDAVEQHAARVELGALFAACSRSCLADVYRLLTVVADRILYARNVSAGIGE